MNEYFKRFPEIVLEASESLIAKYDLKCTERGKYRVRLQNSRIYVDFYNYFRDREVTCNIGRVPRIVNLGDFDIEWLVNRNKSEVTDQWLRLPEYSDETSMREAAREVARMAEVYGKPLLEGGLLTFWLLALAFFADIVRGLIQEYRESKKEA